ncbi:MAG: helix-turn-helix transcriptional regulator [Firmicutes bacterium]|nr:helix-turn-helix transcriptional regulator [Bacillota bacterium]
MTEAMYYVLLALLNPLHGYGIMKKCKEISQQRISLSPGTLYGVLKRLQEEKYIELVKQKGRRKTYRLTAKGFDALNREYERLFAMVEDGNKLLRTVLGEPEE